LLSDAFHSKIQFLAIDRKKFIGEKRSGTSRRSLEDHILASAQNPEKAAKIIARSFYKDLRRAGFETKQVLVVASELISNLNDALKKTRAKTEGE